MHARLAAAIATLLISCTTVLAAPPAPANQSGGGSLQGTSAEQAACNPDATRYCVDVMPDTLAVLGCLQDHREKLRKACRKVLESHGE
jgi:hypothetical protein